MDIHKNSEAFGDSGEVSVDDLAALLQRVNEQMERIEERLAMPHGASGFQKEWYTVPEAAKLLGKRPFTVREWARLGRIEAEKRPCGRGRTSEWIISHDAIESYLNEGLLPLDR